MHSRRFIRNYKNTIVSLYENYSFRIAEYLGRMGFCVFLIEPGFYQNYNDENGLTGEEMTELFDLIVSIIKRNLPNAAIFLDINQSNIKTISI